MTSAQSPGLAHSTAPQTLRALLNRNRAQNTTLPVADAVRLVVPLCVEVADIHRQGYGVYLHPSNILTRHDRLELSSELAATPPSQPEDLACMPPEFRPGELGDARTTVYSVGAILYELVTGAQAGPNMRRPTQLVPGLSHEFELLLANALISDAAHRPDDLNALAQAIYNLAPRQSVAPPNADEGRVSLLGVDVDVSLSMFPTDDGKPHHAPGTGPVRSMAALGATPMPPRLQPQAAHPEPAVPTPPASAGGPPSSQVISAPGSGFQLGVVDARQAPRGDVATAQLAALKSEIERDTQPHYMVIKDGMDHGPFSGVELLQQLGSHAFVAEDLILDQRTNEQRLVGDWPQFAPFAEHARRHRDIAQEKAAIEVGVATETKRTRGKALVGLVVLGLFVAGATTWFLTQVGTRSDEVAVQTENVSNVEAEGDIKSKKGKLGGSGSKAGGKRVVGSQGGIPILAGGQSCEGAQAAYVEEISMTKGGQADITRGQYGAVLNSGAYFSHCGVPSSVAISICAAVQNGRAVGVTVSTTPNHGSRACIASAVRRLSFPSHPKLDVVRASFAAE